MAANDVTVTPANVRIVAGAQTKQITFGETVPAGSWVFRKVSDEKYYLAQSDGTGTADPIPTEQSGNGTELLWALSGGAVDETGVAVLSGNVIVGGTLTKGKVYVLSNTAGLMTLSDDLTSAWYSTIVGVAASTTELKLAITASGYQLA